MPPNKRADWSRRLPRPLTILGVTTLRTLADVRDLIERHLPVAHRDKGTWRYVAARLDEAARGGDVVHVVVPLKLALSLEGVPVE
jgi:hypothetical protein